MVVSLRRTCVVFPYVLVSRSIKVEVMSEQQKAQNECMFVACCFKNILNYVIGCGGIDLAALSHYFKFKHTLPICR